MDTQLRDVEGPMSRFFDTSSGDISPLDDIARLSKQSPFNDGLVTLSIAYDGFSVDDPLSPIIIETARLVLAF